MLATLTLLTLPVLQAPVAPAAEPPQRPLRWLDLDGDGDLDGLLLRADGALRYLQSDGRGAYYDATAELGLDGVRAAAALLTGDVDADGRVDLVVGGVAGLTLLRQEEGGAFLDITAGSGLGDAGVVQALDWVDLEADGGRDLHVEGPEAHVVFRAEGPGRFTRVDELELGTGRAAVAVRKPAGDEVARGAAGGSGSSLPRGGRSSGAGLSLTDPAPGSGPRTSAARPSRRPVPSPPAAAGSPGAMLGLPGCIKALTDQATPGSCIEASSIPTLGLLHPLSFDFNIDDATGHVGMGTTSPTAGLHSVSQDGLLSDGDLFNGDLPIQGSGTRMLWYPNQAVFRAGNVTGSQWDSSELGPGSAAFGEDTIASGLLSFAAGGDATSSGSYSVAFGRDTVASGSYSFAMGNDSVAEGDFSVAGGNATRAAYAGTAFGRFNVGGGSTTTWVDTDPLFELGNGASTVSRSNAFTVLKDGKVGIGTATPLSPLHVIGRARSTGTGAGFSVYNPNNENASAGFDFKDDIARIRVGGSGPGANGGFAVQRVGDGTLLRVLDSGEFGIGTSSPDVQLHVIGGSDVSPTGGGYVQAGSSSGANVAFDTNEIMARDNGATATLNLNVEGGNIVMIASGTGNVGIGTSSPSFKLEVDGSAGKPGGGSWSSSSDRRLKKNIGDLEGALDTLLALRGVTFEYKDPEAINELAGTRIGFIAQEVEEVLPDWVDEKPDGMKMVTIRGFEALAVEALRELAGKNRVLAERNETLESRNDELEARLATLEAAVEQLAAERD